MHKIEFTHDHIWDAVFTDRRPRMTVYPFEALQTNSYLRKIPVTFQIVFADTRKNPLQTLQDVVVAVGKKPVAKKEDLGKLSLWMAERFIAAYREVFSSWLDYLEKEMTEFSKSSSSRLYWKSLRALGKDAVFKTSTISYEQQLWSVVCSALEDETLWKNVVDVRDSLLPWMNPDMWLKLEKKKQDTKENIAYEEHHKKLVEGTFSEDTLDIVK